MDRPASDQQPLVSRRAAEVLDEHLAAPLAPGLYVVATPIGNLGDISLRALAVLARAQVILAEDTRHSRKLLSHFAIKGPDLVAYHEHNAERERPRVLARLKAGMSVALICDAGTPLVSDPGYKLVRAAREEGISVTSVPGASAALAALTSAGLPSDRFFFEGFLPAKQTARRKRLEVLAAIPATLIVYEAPQRVAAALRDMAAVLGDREAAVARELTKLHETIMSGSLSALAAGFAAEAPKGEIVLLVGPPAAQAKVTDEAITDRLAQMLETRSVRDAVREVSEAMGAHKSRVYKLALALQERSQ